jgi:ATP-dependent Clp protease adapter protein ClpS
MHSARRMTALQRFLHRFRGWFNPDPGLVLPAGTSLVALQGFLPSGFKHGVEILNDDETPMEFVVWTLNKHVGLDNTSAVRAMLQIHSRGGALLPLASSEEAERVASQVIEHARARTYPLRCRAVSGSGPG